MGEVGGRTKKFCQSRWRELIDEEGGLCGGRRLAAVRASTGRALASQHAKEALPHVVGAFSQPQPSKNNIPSCEPLFDG